MKVGDTVYTIVGEWNQRVEAHVVTKITSSGKVRFENDTLVDAKGCNHSMGILRWATDVEIDRYLARKEFDKAHYALKTLVASLGGATSPERLRKIAADMRALVDANQ